MVFDETCIVCIHVCLFYSREPRFLEREELSLVSGIQYMASFTANISKLLCGTYSTGSAGFLLRFFQNKPPRSCQCYCIIIFSGDFIRHLPFYNFKFWMHHISSCLHLRSKTMFCRQEKRRCKAWMCICCRFRNYILARRTAWAVDRSRLISFVSSRSDTSGKLYSSQSRWFCLISEEWVTMLTELSQISGLKIQFFGSKLPQIFTNVSQILDVAAKR